MLIHYSSAQCGAGKTTAVLREMATNPAQYIYAVDRREVFEDRRNGILKAAADAGLPAPLVIEIAAENGKAKAGTETVTTRIQELPTVYSGNRHVVAIITHAGMTLARHDAFAGWRMVIDEDPALFKAETASFPAMGWAFEHLFHLTPVEGRPDLMRVGIYPGTASIDDFRRDGLASGLAEFRRLAEHGVLLTNETSWENVKAGKAFTWFTLWPLINLAAYDSVQIVANAFNERKNFAIHQAMFPEIVFEEFALSGSRPVWTKRGVEIRYFTDQHQAATSFFESAQGKNFRDKAAEWIADDQADNAAAHYWVANRSFTPSVTVPGQRVSSKVAGLNNLRHCNAVSILYAAKGSSHEVAAIHAMTGLEAGSEIIHRDRELEDLVQIALRSSLRDPHNGQSVTITVYDSVQAAFLKGFLERNGYGVTATLKRIDIGTNERDRKKAGRPRSDKAMTAAERKRKQRERKKAT